MSLSFFDKLSAISKEVVELFFSTDDGTGPLLPFLIDFRLSSGSFRWFILALDKITFVYPWTGQVAVFSFGFLLPSLGSLKCLFMSRISSLSSLSLQHNCMSLLWSFGFFSAVLLDLRHRATLVLPWPASCAAVLHALLSTPFLSSFFTVDVILELLIQVDAGSQIIYCQLFLC